MAEFIPKLKKHGFTFPNYNYLGPGNDYNLEPVDAIDEYARIHDIWYDEYIKQYSEEYPYKYFNNADEWFITKLEELPKDELNEVQLIALNIASNYFQFKKLVFAKATNDIPLMILTNGCPLNQNQTDKMTEMK